VDYDPTRASSEGCMRAGTHPSGSRARLERLRELLAERDPATPEDLMEIMRDHESSPQAFCLHPDHAEGEEASAVMFSMVTDVAMKRMWVAAGDPCGSGYTEIDLTELRR